MLTVYHKFLRKKSVYWILYRKYYRQEPAQLCHGKEFYNETEQSTSSSGMLLGMAAGAALGAVGVMAATQNQRQLRRTTRKVMKGAENAVLQLDSMVGDFVEKHMDS